jgi:lysophospholipase L1-like esterase
MGDSITEITCWRALVWEQITAAGLADKVTFVGSQTTNQQNCKSSAPNWDMHHEGHSGWRAVDIANNYLAKWVSDSKPDIVQFMLGTNDVVGNYNTQQIMAAYTKMVTEMRTENAKMGIIVSPPPRQCKMGKRD